MLSAQKALQRLREGNRRFVTGTGGRDAIQEAALRESLVAEQRPFAIILGCSDSRVPAELIFDQGLGDLFDVRVAANVAASSQIGSVEFAAGKLGTRLVVVLGHSHCGPVLAAVEEIRTGTRLESPHLRALVDRVRVAVDPLLTGQPADDTEKLVERAIRANVRASVEQLRSGSAILSSLARNDGLQIVGAEYLLETGVVDFFAGVPEGW